MIQGFDILIDVVLFDFYLQYIFKVLSMVLYCFIMSIYISTVVWPLFSVVGPVG